MTLPAGAGSDTSDMLAVHAALRSSLGSAPDFIASAAGDDQRRALIANYYDNLIEFLRVHHEGEEALVFPLLAERAPEQMAVVATAKDQHEEVVSLMATVGDRRTAWEAEGDPAADGLVGAIGTLNDVLCVHLSEEEATVLPVASVCLTPEEWGRLPGHAMGSFTGDKVWLILGLIRENLTQDQCDHMLANMPPPARQMWEQVGESSFDALITEVRQGA